MLTTANRNKNTCTAVTITFIPPEPLNWDYILKLIPLCSAQDIASLTPTHQEYYFYLSSILLPGFWSHLANTFSAPSKDKQIRQIASSVYGRYSGPVSTSYARLHKICMLLLQQNPTKDEIIGYLKTALNNQETPKLYTASLLRCLSTFQDIQEITPQTKLYKEQ